MPENTTHRKKKKGWSMHTRVLLGLLIGAVAGVAANLLFGPTNAGLVWTVKNITQPLGDLWLRLLLMIVIPLIFSALVLGVAGLGDIRKLGRVGVKTFLYTLVMTAVSVVIGVMLVNLVEPGKRISAETTASLQSMYGAQAKDVTASATENAEAVSTSKVPLITTVVERLIPENPFAAMASNTPNLLHIMFFALVLGLASTMIGKERSTTFIDFFESLSEISNTIIAGIMKLAPFAVTFLIFSSVASFGLDLMVALLWFVLVVVGGLFIHCAVVYSTSVYFLSGLSPLDFFRKIKVTAITAFSTSSSNATLPTALRESRDNLGVPEDINSFVLTIGATANQNGTALYEGVTVIFLAQLAGIDLSLESQFVIAYLAILGGIGTAGVPGASIPYIVAIAASVGIDPVLITIILGVDRILNMCRAMVNVIGDITIATFVARSEGYSLKGELRPPARQPVT